MPTTWDDIKKSADHLAQKVVVKADDLTDMAALIIRKKTQEARLSEAYEELGKLYYKVSVKAEGKCDELDRVRSKITSLIEDIEDTETQIRLSKEKKNT